MSERVVERVGRGEHEIQDDGSSMDLHGLCVCGGGIVPVGGAGGSSSGLTD